MRTVKASDIRDTVAALCIRANRVLPEDVRAAIERARADEPWPGAKRSLGILLDNLSLAKERALSAEELSERDALRKEYIEAFRRATIDVLEHTYILTPDGKKHPLPRRDGK